MDFISNMPVSWWINIVEGVLLLGVWSKYQKLKGLIRTFSGWVLVRQNAWGDGSVSEKEWALIGRASDSFLIKLQGIIKGLFSNVSKVAK